MRQPISLFDAPFRGHCRRFAIFHEGSRRPIDVSKTNLSCEWGDGNIISTAPDVALFFSALRSGKLVKPASLDFMTTWRQAGAMREFGRYRRYESLFIDRLGADGAVEVAIGAFREAKRPMHIDPEARIGANRGGIRHAALCHARLSRSLGQVQCSHVVGPLLGAKQTNQGAAETRVRPKSP